MERYNINLVLQRKREKRKRELEQAGSDAQQRKLVFKPLASPFMTRLAIAATDTETQEIDTHTEAEKDEEM